MMEELGSHPHAPGLLGAAGSAVRLWRAAPGRIVLLVGVLTLAWSTPWLVASHVFKEKWTGLAGLLVTIAGAAWGAPLLAAQLRFGLSAVREGRASARDLIDGLRMSGHSVVLWTLLTIPGALSNLLPTSSMGPVEVISFLVVSLASVVLVRFGMSPVLMADTGRGPLCVLRMSWILTRKRSLQVLGLCLFPLPVLVFLSLVTGGRTIAAVGFFLVAIYPFWLLAYVRFYVECAGQPRLAAAGLAPAAEA